MGKLAESIEKIIEGLATKQFKAVVNAVDKKGLMNTDWSDIDDEGGHLDFNTIALAIEKWIMERKPKLNCQCKEERYNLVEEWQSNMEENK